MTRAETLLIVNPYARHGETARLIPAIERLLSNLDHDTLVTTGPQHAMEVARRDGAGRRLVVCAGGDGTAHEVLNGLMHLDESKRPVMGLLPTGSGNDLRRTLGIPNDLAAAALTLTTGALRTADVGVCNGTYFGGSFAAGLDARVTAKAIQYKETTNRAGLWLYLSALLHILANDRSPIHVNVSFDGEEAQALDALIIAMTIGQTYGGGFKITPDAIFDDGLFDVCMIDPLSLSQALARLPFVILGKHTKMKVVRMSRRFSAVIESETPIPAQMDGEVFAETRYEISLLPNAITFKVPVRR